MPGKSRHKPHSKKGKARQRSSAAPAQQPAVARPPAPAGPAPAPSAGEKAHPASRPPAVRYPYVTAELKRIGVLAGAMLVILIVLALVLP